MGVQIGHGERAGLGGLDGVREVHARCREVGPEEAAEHVTGQPCEEAGRSVEPGQGHRRVGGSAARQHAQGKFVPGTRGFGERVSDALSQDGDLARAHGLLSSWNAPSWNARSGNGHNPGLPAKGLGRATAEGRCRFVTSARH
ncbi:hypothetical protein SHIRM173S_03309 [Streptomyces hirsutus]